jgi:hypothetical protein
MKYSFLLFLVVSPLFALEIGCNTANVTQPAPIDAGPPCPTRAPTLTCEAGAPVAATPGTCTGGVTLVPDVGEGIDASSIVPAGSYQAGCTISFWVQDIASSDCLPTEPCRCVAGSVAEDAGASDAGASAAAWSCVLQ